MEATLPSKIITTYFREKKNECSSSSSSDNDCSYLSEDEDDLENQSSSSEEENEDKKMNIDEDWEKVTVFEKKVDKVYDSKHGPNLPENFVISPINIFHKFFTQEVYDLMVTQTNLYVKQCKVEKAEYLKEHPKARLNFWQDINEKDIKKFIGLIMVMGVHSNAEIKDNWSLDPFFFTKFSKVIPRDKFLLIQRYIHLADNTSDDTSRLKKVNKFCNLLIKNWSTIYTPGPNIAVDESMIPFSGRLLIKQYLPLKPVKWGIKMYTLADSPKGYVCNAIIYDGKNDNYENYSTLNVVMKLVDMYKNTNRHIFTDRFYSSINLLEELEKNGLYFTGTINAKRKGIPKVDKLTRDEIIYWRKSNKLFLAWQPKKNPVLMISNYYGIGVELIKFTNKRTNQLIINEKPQIVHGYNRFSKSVDLNNGFCRYYRFDHRNYRWWKSIFYYFIELCISNTYVIMCHYNKKSTLKDTRLQIARILINDDRICKSSYSSKTKCQFHMPDFIPDKRDVKDFRKKCYICKRKTSYHCPKCTYVEYYVVALCVPECFQKYHI